ncbi:hypothetical protein [Haliscomenobacter sp.]|uniref:hypothetical protein n=1 Tax=Haliscomenobacter sp. TaxID=2717303 RepID=UPI003593FEE5
MLSTAQVNNYLSYHREIVRAEEHLANQQFKESLTIYRSLSDRYEHVFRRDFKVAAQLSAQINDTDHLFYFLEQGMKKGWTLKEIKKNKILKAYKNHSFWQKLKNNQLEYEKEFHKNLNEPLRIEMKEMLAQDQKRALRVALTPVRAWRERYTNRKFVPNNRAQVRRINQIIDEFGYPGEKIIGDKSWATVIISHNEHDTIYKELRPKLYKAFEKGELSAIELAMIETWRVVVDTERKDQGFAIWEQTINAQEASHADSLRQNIGLRSIALNNKLILLEKELGMNFFLSPFHGGIITVKE